MDEETIQRAQDLLVRSKFKASIEACLIAFTKVKQPSRDSARICLVLLQALFEAGRFVESKDLLSNKFGGFANIDFDTVCLWSVLALESGVHSEVAHTLQRYLKVNSGSLSDEQLAAGARLLCIETFCKEQSDFATALRWIEKNIKGRSETLHAQLRQEIEATQKDWQQKSDWRSRSQSSQNRAQAPFSTLPDRTSNAMPDLSGPSTDSCRGWENGAGSASIPAHSQRSVPNAATSVRYKEGVAANRPDSDSRKGHSTSPGGNDGARWVNMAILAFLAYVFFVDTSILRWLQRLGSVFKDSLVGLLSPILSLSRR